MTTIEDEEELREAFWEAHPELLPQRVDGRQNAQVADIRMAWCDFVDFMQKDGRISEELAFRANL